MSTGFIYFIRSGSRGPIKIGYTADPIARLSQLQVANPCELKLLGCVPGTLDVERAIHRELSGHRLRGEWYVVNEHIRAFVKVHLNESVSEEVLQAHHKVETLALRALPSRSDSVRTALAAADRLIQSSKARSVKSRRW